MDNKKSFLIKQFILFNIIGIINTLITFGIYSLCIKLGVNYRLALILEYVFGIIFSFIMNKNITFKHITGNTVKMFIKMVLTYIVTFGVNMGILSLFVEILQLNEYLSQFIALGIVSVLSFILQKIIVFREKHRS